VQKIGASLAYPGEMRSIEPGTLAEPRTETRRHEVPNASQKIEKHILQSWTGMTFDDYCSDGHVVEVPDIVYGRMGVYYYPVVN